MPEVIPSCGRSYMISRNDGFRAEPSNINSKSFSSVWSIEYPLKRKLLLLSLSVLTLGQSASAATLGPLTCTPFPVTFANGTGGPTPVSCPAFTVGGAVLTGAALSYQADYQFGSNPGPNTVELTFTPTGPAGVTWSPASAVATVMGGQSSGALGTANADAIAGVTTANFAAPFNVNVSSQVTQGTVATSSGAVMLTYTYDVAPPPAPLGAICSASAPPVFAAGVPNAFLVRYASNLSAGDSAINLVNNGAASSIAFPIQNGNINANVYVFSPDEQLISCCCCQITPDGLVSLSARNDLISNTLTPSVPTSAVVKLVATSAPSGALIDGLSAWGTTLHSLPVTPGTPAVTYGVTETPFLPATLSAAELTRLTTLCSLIQTNGSGFGICRSCRLGGLGASRE